MRHLLITVALAGAADPLSGFSGSAATLAAVAPKFGGDTSGGHAHMLSVARCDGSLRFGVDAIATDLHLLGFAPADRDGTGFLVERLDIAGHLFLGTHIGSWFVDGLFGADWNTGFEFGVRAGYLPWTFEQGAIRAGPDALLLVQVANLDVRLAPVIALGLRAEFFTSEER